MGIGTGTGVAGSAIPPQIRESETTAFVEVNKMALAIMPQDSFETVAFTQQDAHMHRKYDTKASDPLMKPMLQSRMAKMQRDLDDTAWKPIYDELIVKLPALIKELLITENNKPFLSRDMNFVVLDNLLKGTAKMINWLGSASISAAPNTPAGNLNELNSNLSKIALNGAVRSFEGISSDLHSQLNGLGANFIGHDHISNVLNQLDTLLPLFGILSKQAAAGEDVKQSFVALSDATHRLAELNNKEATTGEFRILGSVLQTLDTIAAAWALENGSPSLLIGSELASINQSGALNTIMDQLIEGLQGSMGSGLRAQLGELDSLQSGLRALRDG